MLMTVSKGVKKLYKILVDNNFQPMSPQELTAIAGYKSVNSIDQILNRNSDYFTVQGGMGNRRVTIPKGRKNFAVFVRDNLHCVYCNQPVTIDNATIDHIKPDSKGKMSDPSNLATACKSCNSLKKDMSANRYIDEVLDKDRMMLARDNVKRIAGQIPGKKRGKSTRKKETSIPQSTVLSDENKLKMLIRQVVQSEMGKKKHYEYSMVYIIEKAGYYSCIEDGDEWTVDDDNGQPISTIEDIMNELANDGWRFVQLVEFTHFRVDILSSGKQFMAFLEKAL